VGGVRGDCSPVAVGGLRGDGMVGVGRTGGRGTRNGRAATSLVLQREARRRGGGAGA